MTYTEKRPTVAGWYWVKTTAGARGVYEYDPSIGGFVRGIEIVRFNGSQFSGPIPEPVELLCDCGKQATKRVNSLCFCEGCLLDYRSGEIDGLHHVYDRVEDL